MKIALICPSNKLYMPYMGNYETILKANNADYDVISWDRFGIEGKSDLIYKDNKVGHRRCFFDYCRFKRFIYRNLDSDKYDKVIVFGIPTMLFLKKMLLDEFEKNYVIDIRDYHKMINYFNMDDVINKSSFTTLSSPRFREWLPNSDKYIVNHNTQIGSPDELKNIKIPCSEEKIVVSCIGIIKDYQINISFIDSLKNSSQIVLYFHGEGGINKNIKKYLDRNGIKNVYLTGCYKRGDEPGLYLNSDIINVLVSNGSINNKTLLPNRLYSAILYGKPMIVFEGTYLAEQVKRYGIGMSVDSFDDIEKKINNYLEEFDTDMYDRGRKNFLEFVVEENNEFKIQLEDFITKQTNKVF